MMLPLRDHLRIGRSGHRIACVPLEAFLRETGRPVSFARRDYCGTWEVLNDALHLVEFLGLGNGGLVALRDLFPGSDGPVEATWFSGLVTSDDAVDPRDELRVALCDAYSRPYDFTWFAHIIYRGKVVREEVLDLESRTGKVRLTEHARDLFPEQEHGFLEALQATPDDLSLRLIYADWLEEREDARGTALRAEVQRTQSLTGKELHCLEGSDGDDVPERFVDPENRDWFWRRLVGIQEPTPAEREQQRRLATH